MAKKNGTKIRKKSGPKFKRGAKGITFSVNMPEVLLKKFTSLAKKQGYSRSDIIFELVTEWAKNKAKGQHLTLITPQLHQK